jgi:hypothetical protein
LLSFSLSVTNHLRLSNTRSSTILHITIRISRFTVKPWTNIWVANFYIVTVMLSSQFYHDNSFLSPANTAHREHTLQTQQPHWTHICLHHIYTHRIISWYNSITHSNLNVYYSNVPAYENSSIVRKGTGWVQNKHVLTL